MNENFENMNEVVEEIKDTAETAVEAIDQVTDAVQTAPEYPLMRVKVENTPKWERAGEAILGALGIGTGIVLVHTAGKAAYKGIKGFIRKRKAKKTENAGEQKQDTNPIDAKFEPSDVEKDYPINK